MRDSDNNNRKTRLCFFNTTHHWGGGEKWHFETASYLASRGHMVLFVVRTGGDLHKRLANHQEIKVVPIAVSNLSFLNPLKLQKLTRIFRAEKPQTVVFNGSFDVKLGAPAARMAGVSATVYRRGLAVPVKNTLFNRFLYGRLITHFLTNSDSTAHILFESLVVSNHTAKTRTIYNGIELGRFKPPCRDLSQNDYGSKLIIGTAGRLEKEKGHEHLLAVARRLKERQMDFKIVIAGEGSYRQHLENQIHNLGLGKEIELLGFVPDVERFMQQIDIFAFPSLWEGFGYATAEAMAASRPVVAFDVSSNREVVENGVTGFLVPSEDAERFSEKILQLAKDPELRSRMGQNGRSRVYRMFDQKKQLGKIENFLCKDVLGQ